MSGKDEKSIVVFDPKPLDIVPVGETGLTSMGALSYLQEEGTFEGADGVYTIYNIGGEPLFADDDWFLCVAKLPSGQFGLVKGSMTDAGYYAIEQEGRILSTMLTLSNQVDAEEVAAGNKVPRYSAAFPNVVEVVDMGDRKIGLFLGFSSGIESFAQFHPLSVITENQRVDLQTTVWMLGKLLKLLSFVHSVDFATNWVSADNILIERAQHGPFVLNWMNATEDANEIEKNLDVAHAAQMVWEAAGGTERTNPPHDADVMSADGYERYIANLKRLMSGDHAGASAEFDALYALADSIWEKVPSRSGGLQRPFHTFVTYPR